MHVFIIYCVDFLIHQIPNKSDKIQYYIINHNEHRIDSICHVSNLPSTSESES